MSSYVIESVDEAAKKTREVLLPFDLGTWSRLALIVLLTGGIGFGFPAFPSMGGHDYSEQGSYSSSTVDSSSEVAAGGFSGVNPSNVTGAFYSSSIVYLGVAILVGLVLFLVFLSSVFELVYYRSLIDGKIRIRESFSENLDRGSRYFLFRALFSLGMIFAVFVSVALAIFNPLLLVPLVLAALPLALVIGGFNIMVHDFVLLEMLEREKKFLEALSSVFNRIRQDWRNFGLYILMKFILGFLAASALGLAAVFVVLVLAIPGIILGALAMAINPVLLVPVVILGLLVSLAGLLYLSVPVKTFLYYYAISVYQELPE